jgi:DNA topoisomerase-1
VGRLQLVQKRRETGVSPEEVSARSAGLRYVSDKRPGITRQRSGSGFVYRRPDGSRVTDAATLQRIRRLVIPPAWQDVWISTDPNGHLQAVGRDARGRKQYRYHAQWRTVRDEAKFGRMIEFGQTVAAIRRRVAADLRQPPRSREHVLAMVMRLLERTLIRVGNDEYARANRSYGLTTLRSRHVSIRGAKLRFTFRAKSGVPQRIDLEDARLARSVRRCQDLPGQTLFQYVDDDGAAQAVDSGDVNAYLRASAGEDFSAKDFRTWAGTVLAAMVLADLPDGVSQTARQRALVAAVDVVASRLGNTRAVCRRCYIHPAVLEAYLDGETIDVPPGQRRVVASPGSPLPRAAEQAVLALLKRRLSRAAKRAA